MQKRGFITRHIMSFFKRIYLQRKKKMWELSDDWLVRIGVSLLLVILIVSIIQYIKGYGTTHISNALIFVLLSAFSCALGIYMLNTVRFSVVAGLTLHFLLASVALLSFSALQVAYPLFNELIYAFCMILVYTIIWSYISLRGSTDVTKIVNSIVANMTSIIVVIVNLMILLFESHRVAISDIAQLKVNVCLAPFILSSLFSTALVDLYEHYVKKYENNDQVNTADQQ